MEAEQKWAAFAGIPAESWRQISAPDAQRTVWVLRDDWRVAIFGDEYKLVATNAAFWLGVRGLIVFVTSLNIYEVRAFSRQLDGAYYDFSWSFDVQPSLDEPSSNISQNEPGSLTRRAISITRRRDEADCGFATVVWLINPRTATIPVPTADMNIRIFSAEIDEIIDLNPATLEVRQHESAREIENRLLPWRRLMVWLGRLRELDRNAFQKIPGPLKSFLAAPDAYARIDGLTMEAFQEWTRQGVLPDEPAVMAHEEAAPLRESVRLQQQLASQPSFLKMFNQFCPIPPLLMSVDANALDSLDLQAFMTIGALRELHGFLEVEMKKLVLRRPDMMAILKGPQGLRQFELDAEVRALRVHPLAVQEQQDAQDLVLRQAGQYGPTARDLTRFQERHLAMINAQTMGIVNPLMGLAAAWKAERQAQASNIDLPWKIYTPYIC